MCQMIGDWEREGEQSPPFHSLPTSLNVPMQMEEGGGGGGGLKVSE